jgi:arylsulfatase A-like enzyme
MNAASLFVVFVLAKLAVLSGHTLPSSAWSPLAYFWQDAAVALAVATVEIATPKTARSIYWVFAVYTAINIPVGRVLFTPLTWPMLRAARGPLADSLRLYVTWENVLLVTAVLTTAAVLPSLWGRLLSCGRLPIGLLVVALLVMVIGPFASTRIDTLGMDRNVLVALCRTGPGLSISMLNSIATPATTPPEDLSGLRSKAKDLNVVLISLESTAAQYLRLYGGEYNLTPNLDALAANSVVFENAYAAYPESIKGLYSILCSAYPTNEDPGCRSVAEQLARTGYQTALFHSGRFAYLGMESVLRNRGYQTLEDAGAIGGNHNSSFGVDEPSTVARTLSWLDSLPPGQKFFLTYLPIAGHHPYETPERGPFLETEEIGRYRNAIRYGDASLGTLVEGLRARGLDRNTLWIVLGDHGEAFGQHEGNYGHTFFLYEENVHVPFVIAAPGLMHGQTRVRDIVSLIDTAPTILDLLGLPIPSGYEGQSMLQPRTGPVYFFTDYSLHLTGWRHGPYKLVCDVASGRSKLFDLDRDPQERNPLECSNGTAPPLEFLHLGQRSPECSQADALLLESRRTAP